MRINARKIEIVMIKPNITKFRQSGIKLTIERHEDLHRETATETGTLIMIKVSVSLMLKSFTHNTELYL